MKKLAFTILFLLLVCNQSIKAQALDAEDLLRNLPAPDINYPLEEIRVVPHSGSAFMATEAVPLPPSEPSYEAKKIVEQVKSAGSSRVIKSTRKLISNLSKPAPKPENNHASATAGIAASGTREIVKAARPAPLVATSTRVVSAARTLAANPAIEQLKSKIASDTALAGDLLTLFIETYRPAESGKESGKESGESAAAAGKFDSVMVTATGLQKKQSWQEIKSLFADNPEAGETPDGLRFQIEAELNSVKPNYMAAQRFANKLIETEKTDPLANYALAMYFCNSSKPNLDKAKKALDIALKAKTPPAGASTLYWTMTLKKLALPLLLLLGGLIAGANHLIKKRKAARLNILDDAGVSQTESLPEVILSNLDAEKPASPLKQKITAFKEKIHGLISKLPFGRKKVVVEGTQGILDLPEGKPLADKEALSEEKPVIGPDSEAIDSSEGDETTEEHDSELFELEGADSAILEESSDEELEEIEEVVEEEEVEEIEDTEEEKTGDTEEIVEYVEVEEDEPGAEKEIEESEDTDTEEEIVEYVEVEEGEVEGDEEVEYEEIEVEVEEEDEEK